MLGLVLIVGHDTDTASMALAVRLVMESVAYGYPPGAC